MHGFCTVLRFKMLLLQGLRKCRPWSNNSFARFCATKRYYSSAYVNVGTGVIALARFCATKRYSSSAYINVGTRKRVFLRRTSQNACI